MITKRNAFLFGIFGAILPELLRIAKRSAQSLTTPPSGWGVYSMVMLYVLAAGVMSVAWKPDTE